MNAEQVLIDTSAWIEYFRRAQGPVTQEVTLLLSGSRAVLTGVVVAELLQGARDAREVEAIRKLRDVVPSLGDSAATWEEAGLLARELRRKGQEIALIDCYLAVLAQTHRCSVLSLDRHFLVIARHRPLELLSLGK